MEGAGDAPAAAGPETRVTSARARAPSDGFSVSPCAYPPTPTPQPAVASGLPSVPPSVWSVCPSVWPAASKERCAPQSEPLAVRDTPVSWFLVLGVGISMQGSSPGPGTRGGGEGGWRSERPPPRFLPHPLHPPPVREPWGAGRHCDPPCSRPSFPVLGARSVPGSLWLPCPGARARWGRAGSARTSVSGGSGPGSGEAQPGRGREMVVNTRTPHYL